MKYFSKKVRNEHGEFDSQSEYGRYLFLKYRQDRREISELTQHVRFEIIPKLVRYEEKQLKTKVKVIERVEEKAAHYTCDFTYRESDGKFIIEEVKSKGTMMARDYPLRKKLIKQLIHKHNEEIGFEDWVFREFVPPTTRTPRKRKK